MLAFAQRRITAGRPSCRPTRLTPGLRARGRELGVMNDRRSSRRGHRFKHRRLRRPHRHPGHDQSSTHAAVRTTGVKGDEVRRVAARAVVARCTHGHVCLGGMRHRQGGRHGDGNEAQSQQRNQEGSDKAHNPHVSSRLRTVNSRLCAGYLIYEGGAMLMNFNEGLPGAAFFICGQAKTQN
jgi:hypothetical protein